MLYLRYCGDQFNLIVCQETDGKFCGRGSLWLLNYYIPICLVTLILAQGRNYKQLSYMAKLAIIATMIALGVLLTESLVKLVGKLHVAISGHSSDSHADVNFELDY
jgi:hypothetical protein